MTYRENYLLRYAAPAVRWLRDRMAFFTQPAALPLILLLLATSTVFMFGNDRGHFYRDGLHEWDSSKNLTLAENLSPRHYFAGFQYQSVDWEGNRYYSDLYNRFPKGGYVLIKLAILPFGDDFGAAIYAARMLMLLLLTGAATLAYLSLARLVGSGWIALTATLLAFSSYYILYYADSISNEGTTDLFAVMLAFHGMVVFAQEGRFRQLLVKSCLALLLGWHVYAFLLPFIIFGLAGELFKARAGISTPPPPSLTAQIKRCGAALLSNRYATLGVVTLGFGVALLAANLSSEYIALGGEAPLGELPSVVSATYRLGGDTEFNTSHAEELTWGPFLENQLYRIGRMTIPFLISTYDSTYTYEHWGGAMPGDYPGVIVGILALVICGIGLIYAPVKHKMLLATLVVSGFCWALPLRNSVTFHDFEAMFYVGIPLVLFALLLLGLRKLSSPQFVSIFAVGALLVFVLSNAEMANIGHSVEVAKAEDEMMQDFKVIRDVVGDGIVYIPFEGIGWGNQFHQYSGAPWAFSYFLAGSVITYEHRNLANFVIERQYEPGPALLTPDNRRVFLYDRALYDGQYDAATLGSPIIASDWNVYPRDGRRLIYTSEECANTDASFFLHIVPFDVNDLPEHRQQYGFDNLDFRFGDVALLSDGRCVAVRELPGYDIAAIRTGQYTDDGPLWEGEYRFER